MRLRNQTVDDAPERPLAEVGGQDQNDLRERAASLLAAADEAIARALSNDSEEFLAQNRQAGGE